MKGLAWHALPLKKGSRLPSGESPTPRLHARHLGYPNTWTVPLSKGKRTNRWAGSPTIGTHLKQTPTFDPRCPFLQTKQLHSNLHNELRGSLLVPLFSVCDWIRQGANFCYQAFQECLTGAKRNLRVVHTAQVVLGTIQDGPLRCLEGRSLVCP